MQLTPTQDSIHYCQFLITGVISENGEICWKCQQNGPQQTAFCNQYRPDTRRVWDNFKRIKIQRESHPDK